jgi:hypothetical protein
MGGKMEKEEDHKTRRKKAMEQKAATAEHSKEPIKEEKKQKG